jgi:DNA-binding CsgD family transcriptional regulator
LPELIESAVRCGRRDLAKDALRRLSRKAAASGTAWALGIEARARAQLSDGDTAEAQFRAALDHLSRARVRAERARTHLLFGEWLRRENRRTAARTELQTAYEMFTAMDMPGFASRTYGELLAAGATVHRPAAAAHDLTAQEAHIARLARDGLSNSEIGAQLFISARTVEWHLRKVFAKLGVTSRRQLRALSDSGPVTLTVQPGSVPP